MTISIRDELAWKRLIRRTRRCEKTGCWLWTGSRGAYGYGQARSRDGRKTTASRAIYEAMHGPIDPALDVDHLCRNRLCVNPTHLEAITHRENIIRSHLARGVVTHCPLGHEKAMMPYGRMRCRECNRTKGQRFRERAKMRTLAEQQPEAKP